MKTNADPNSTGQTEDGQRELLLEEFKALQGRIVNFSTLRFSALGAGLTLIAIFISISKGSTGLILLGYILIISTLGLATTRMVGAFNRGCYIFEDQAGWISETLDMPGFSRVWRHYVVYHPQDSGAHAFVIASRSLNVICMLYAVTNCVQLLVSLSDFPVIVGTWLALVYVVVVGISNEVYIQREISPKRIVPEIEEKMAQARERAGLHRSGHLEIANSAVGASALEGRDDDS